METYSFHFPTGHRWNCTQVWKKDVFGHVVIVGEYIYLIKIYILKAVSIDFRVEIIFKIVLEFCASACICLNSHNNTKAIFQGTSNNSQNNTTNSH